MRSREYTTFYDNGLIAGLERQHVTVERVYKVKEVMRGEVSCRKKQGRQGRREAEGLPSTADLETRCTWSVLKWGQAERHCQY